MEFHNYFTETVTKILQKMLDNIKTSFWNAGRNFWVKDFIEIKKNFVKILIM